MKKILALTLLLILGGCSNLTKNYVKKGDFKIRNGKIFDKVWKEDFNLKRVSWYQELTMQYDVIIGKIDSNSGFYNWFSADEKKQIANCSEFNVILAYSLNTNILPYSYLNEQLEVAGYSKIELNTFKRNLNQHPDANEYSLNLYKVIGACKTLTKENSLKLSLPGYEEIYLD